MLDIMQYIDMEILKLAGGLIALMISNILLGARNSFLNQQFDIKKLRQGLIKATVVTVSFILVYVAGLLNMDIITVDVNGEVVNLIAGINLLLSIAALWYAKEVFIKLKSFVVGKIDTGEGM